MTSAIKEAAEESVDAVYPLRPGYFAHKFCRLLAKAAVAQEIGPEACWLLAVIAHQEDAKKYSGPVTFWNEQLMPVSGFGGKSRLVNARNRAIEHGWLHYEQGKKATIGKYWVLVPNRYHDLSDNPVDESSDAVLIQDGNEMDNPTFRPDSGRQPDGNRTANQPHSSLSLIPNPNTDSSCPGRAPDVATSAHTETAKARSRTYTDEDMAVAQWIWGLIVEMQPGRKPPSLPKWADDVRLMRDQDGRTHEEIRSLFGAANADSFWRANVLSPDKLREKWDNLMLRLKIAPPHGGAKQQSADAQRPKVIDIYRPMKPI